MKKISLREHRGSSFYDSVNDDGTWPDSALVNCLLQDIRDTLVEIRTAQRSLLGIFQCPNTQAGFRALRSLARSERQRLEAAKQRRAKKGPKR